MQIAKGKFNILLDGQFGSTGKGLVAAYIGTHNEVDIAVSNAGANSGHTFYDAAGHKQVVQHLPISGILNPRSLIYICAGAVIKTSVLLKEMQDFHIDPDRVYVHPRCAVIDHVDTFIENHVNDTMTDISSTKSGTGCALARKVSREGVLAEGTDELCVRGIVRRMDLHKHMENGAIVLMEVPQGFDLSIASGLSYPHCTSREITVPQALADAQVHPHFLGKTIVCIRTFPIRVGNVRDEQNVLISHSGPFYQDSMEITWDDIGVEPEHTTVTGKARRVATFSMRQYNRMRKHLRPDYIVLNFANYLADDRLHKLLKKLPHVTHIGLGPKIQDIRHTPKCKYKPNDSANDADVKKLMEALPAIVSDIKHQPCSARNKITEQNIKRQLYYHVIRELLSKFKHTELNDNGVQENIKIKGFVRDVWEYLETMYDTVHDDSWTQRAKTSLNSSVG